MITFGGGNNSTAIEDTGEVRSICESICSDGSSATVQPGGSNQRPRMDIACVLDITQTLNLAHRKRALEEVRLASDLVNANLHHIPFEKLDFGETNVLDTFYNADVALVDLSLQVQQSSLLYHLGVRESFDMKENVLLYNDVDADSTLRLKVIFFFPAGYLKYNKHIVFKCSLNIGKFVLFSEEVVQSVCYYLNVL